MGVPGIIVARTDAEAANLLEGCADERDQPFILGVTNVAVPTYRAVVLSIMRRLSELGVEAISGYRMFALSDAEYRATPGLAAGRGVGSPSGGGGRVGCEHRAVDRDGRFDMRRSAGPGIDVWQSEARLMTFSEAGRRSARLRACENDSEGMSVDEWRSFSTHCIVVRKPAESGGARCERHMGLRAREDH